MHTKHSIALHEIGTQGRQQCWMKPHESVIASPTTKHVHDKDLSASIFIFGPLILAKDQRLPTLLKN